MVPTSYSVGGPTFIRPSLRGRFGLPHTHIDGDAPIPTRFGMFFVRSQIYLHVSTHLCRISPLFPPWLTLYMMEASSPLGQVRICGATCIKIDAWGVASRSEKSKAWNEMRRHSETVHHPPLVARFESHLILSITTRSRSLILEPLCKCRAGSGWTEPHLRCWGNKHRYVEYGHPWAPI